MSKVTVKPPSCEHEAARRRVLDDQRKRIVTLAGRVEELTRERDKMEYEHCVTLERLQARFASCSAESSWCIKELEAAVASKNKALEQRLRECELLRGTVCAQESELGRLRNTVASRSRRSPHDQVVLAKIKNQALRVSAEAARLSSHADTLAKSVEGYVRGPRAARKTPPPAPAPALPARTPRPAPETAPPEPKRVKAEPVPKKSRRSSVQTLQDWECPACLKGLSTGHNHLVFQVAVAERNRRGGLRRKTVRPVQYREDSDDDDDQ